MRLGYRMNNELILVRHGGLGDELCMTPIYRNAKYSNPNTDIIVFGKHAQDILKYNPHVIAAYDTYDRWLNIKRITDARIVDIKWHNEAGYGHEMHLVDFYASQVGIELADKHLDLYLSDDDMEYAKWMDKLPRPIVCYNVDGGWRSREVPMHLVAAELITMGTTVIQVGCGKSYTGVGYNMVGMNSSIRDLGAILSKADMYIGGDSGIFHIASAVGTKCVVVFGPVNSEYRIHDPDRELAIYTSDCHGCFSPSTQDMVIKGGCPHNNSYICTRINPKDIADTVMENIDGEYMRR